MSQLVIEVRNHNDKKIPYGNVTRGCVGGKCGTERFAFTDGSCVIELPSVDHEHRIVVEAVGYDSETLKISSSPYKLGILRQATLKPWLITGNIPPDLRKPWNDFLKASKSLKEAKEQDKDPQKKLLEEARKRLIDRLREHGVRDPEKYLESVEYKISTSRQIIWEGEGPPPWQK